ncbi:glycosyltransferase family 1 protein [Pseudomonas sp. CC120222-01a]|uniref:glycosyltransferase family 4 protein n=1 Tax=Pseudomonas sp. CC120222-01a TaxID=1378075 RepID=UPI000D93F1E6|nr:glycosyltransferase family 1 protein [Pseudomonas sp. CC120222-01a]PVZ32935.1 glycosyltransferase involved in cell wall biosynthesis [Pseudomonas sp. CC120222-01a]
MKIVINAFSARLGGGQTYLINLLKHIPLDEGLSILVLAPDDLQLPSHPAISRYAPRYSLNNPILRTVWEKFLLPGYLRKVKADVLFCPGGVVATQAPTGCKVVTMFRNMIPFDKRVLSYLPFGLQRIRSWLLYHTMLRSMSRADLTIFISDFARGVIEKLANIPNPVTIPHGIGEAFRTFDKQLARPGRLPTESYMLYVSRFDVYKHHYEVVSAYAKLPVELRERYHLVLIGESDMPGAERVHELINDLDLGGRVIILGAVPYAELPSYYHHAELALFASSCENCPNIMLEALGAGRPVLSSNVMPMPEFGAQAAAYFSPFDADDISRVMNTVLSDRNYSQQLADAAASQCQKFDWAKTSESTWAEIFKLVAHAK